MPHDGAFRQAGTGKLAVTLLAAAGHEAREENNHLSFDHFLRDKP